jgi:alpha-N-arabinofuranosidase
LASGAAHITGETVNKMMRYGSFLKAGTWLALGGLMLGLTAGEAAAAPVTLTVESGRVVRHGADKVVGVNLNYIRDADANRPHARPLDAALKDMGARWLRYPGGEKSDFHLWAQPPYDTPHPVSLGYYGTVAGQRMDFDEYIAHCRAVHAEPYVVAGYDTEKRTGQTEAQWIESAAAWVRYANVKKKYGVRFWEIGNENWHNDTAKPEEMAGIVSRFSRAMKAADSSIQIGASGSGAHWWAAFLPTAAPSLDFISLSLYNCWDWKGYDHFVQNPHEDTIGDVETALKAIDHDAPPADRARLRVIVSETNSKDYSDKGWPGTNTLGHTLVTFDTLGRVMAQPRVLAAMVWTTRWMDDGEAKNSQWYALGPDNETLPTGRAVALWGRFVQSEMVAVMGASSVLSGYATRSPDGRTLTVWVLNRGLLPLHDIRVALHSPVSYHQASVHQLSGTGPDDPAPHWGPLAARAVRDNAISGLSCPGVSMTVLTLTAARVKPPR